MRSSALASAQLVGVACKRVLQGLLTLRVLEFGNDLVVRVSARHSLLLEAAVFDEFAIGEAERSVQNRQRQISELADNVEMGRKKKALRRRNCLHSLVERLNH